MSSLFSNTHFRWLFLPLVLLPVTGIASQLSAHTNSNSLVNINMSVPSIADVVNIATGSASNGHYSSVQGRTAAPIYTEFNDDSAASVRVIPEPLRGFFGKSETSAIPQVLVASVTNYRHERFRTRSDANPARMDPPGFPTDFEFLVDSGVSSDLVTSGLPTYDRANGPNQSADYFVGYFGSADSDIFEFVTYNPNGVSVDTVSTNGINSCCVTTYEGSYNLGSNPPLGLWRLDIELNGEVIATHNFQVIDSLNPGAIAIVYISPSNPANVGFNFYDEDIIVHDGESWNMFFDGSDVGLGGPPDLNAFHIRDDGTLLLSFDTPVNLGGTLYDDSDIVLFSPTSLGLVTQGTFSMYFDGSSNGFTTIGEDIDAITENGAGELVISTLGSALIPRPPFNTLTQQDDDLARRRNSDGIWLRYFDGSDVGFTFATEDVWGAHVDPSTGVVYLTTLDEFNATDLSGDGNDIFTCTPGTLGSATSCPLSPFWDGDQFGLSGERIDALFVEVLIQLE